ncbi:glycosyltransferase family 4 protein [Halorhodospira halophila]|nr:glycosyltransferase family 4 protein [Halorhodospira halophila]MBK1728794.1 hypothetical protein [Halorhodospira halophila]
MCSNVIVYCSHSAAYTSSPLNEHYIYRKSHFPREQHYYIAINTCKEEKRFKSNEKFRIFECKGNDKKLFEALENIIDAHTPSSNIIIHNHDPKATKKIAHFIKKRHHNIPLVYTIHNSYNKFSARKKCLTNLSILHSSKSVFCGRAAYEAYPYRHLFKQKTTFIPNGVDIDRIDSTLNRREGTSKPNDYRIKVATIAKNNGQKNLPHLLKLASELPKEMHLSVIGPLSDEDKNKIESLDTKNVRHVGVLERDEALLALSQNDIFASSSFYEGLPVAVLEAMAIGLPVVLSRIPPHLELSSKGDGPIVAECDLSLWKQKIRELNELKQQKNNGLQELGQLNRKLVEEHFSLAAMHKAYSSVYKELLY